MKSTLLNMTAVLFGITLIASAGVGVVNMITLEPSWPPRPKRSTGGFPRSTRRSATN